VRALANAQAAAGTPVELLATLEAGQPISVGDDAASLRTFPRVAPRWLSRSPELRQHLLASSPDVLHSHALWLLPLHYAHTAARRHRAPLIIAPRGMMSGWAYQHRRWKKWIAERLVHPGAFKAAAAWHATSQQEADDIRALGFTQPICISPNGVDLPADDALSAARTTWQERVPLSRSRRIALFYSRFHRKKRVRELIDLWLSEPRGDWHLLIAGVAEEFTAEDLQRIIVSRAATDQITIIDSTGMPPPYAIASLFVLPSRSENFGLVIAEALASGVPTLVSDRTPWEGLAPRRAGWCVSWEEFGYTLRRALQHTPIELVAMGANGRAWVADEFSWTRVADILSKFYRELIKGN
jgi:glycosyltransferase involved in cell wall biosynthesis